MPDIALLVQLLFRICSESCADPPSCPTSGVAAAAAAEQAAKLLRRQAVAQADTTAGELLVLMVCQRPLRHLVMSCISLQHCSFQSDAHHHGLTWSWSYHAAHLQTLREEEGAAVETEDFDRAAALSSQSDSASREADEAAAAARDAEAACESASRRRSEAAVQQALAWERGAAALRQLVDAQQAQAAVAVKTATQVCTWQSDQWQQAVTRKTIRMYWEQQQSRLWYDSRLLKLFGSLGIRSRHRQLP